MHERRSVVVDAERELTDPPEITRSWLKKLGCLTGQAEAITSWKVVRGILRREDPSAVADR